VESTGRKKRRLLARDYPSERKTDGETAIRCTLEKPTTGEGRCSQFHRSSEDGTAAPVR
jgi:hypothetical protein